MRGIPEIRRVYLSHKYAFGSCMWHGSIYRVRRDEHGRPICPSCWGRLTVVSNALEFWARVGELRDRYPLLPVLLLWSEGDCRGGYDQLLADFQRRLAA